MRNLPPLSALQAFEAAARHMSFTEAARELNCTQAAVSQRVRALESYLSRRLFLRRSNGLQLTEAGEAYLPGVTEALDVAAAATEGLRGRSVPRAVTISAPVSFLTLWLGPRLGGLLKPDVNIEVRLNSAIWTDPNVDLADVTVEVREIAEIDQGAPRLASERLVPLCAPDLAARFAGAEPAAALARTRKIVVQGRHDAWRRWAKGENVPIGSDIPPLMVDNAVCALEAAAQGLGVTVVYSTYAKPYLDGGRLVAPAFSARQTSLCHVLAMPRAHPSWHPAHKVFAWLKSEFAQSASSGPA